MPRDISGNYTLPSGNPVVDGTIIEAPWANDTMEDIALQLNNVLTRDGLLGPTSPFKAVPGTEGLPGYTFQGAVTSGLWLDDPDVVVSVAGLEVARFTPDGLVGAVGSYLPLAGGIMAGNITFPGDTAAGIVFTDLADAVDQWRLAAGTFTTDGDFGIYNEVLNTFALKIDAVTNAWTIGLPDGVGFHTINGFTVINGAVGIGQSLNVGTQCNATTLTAGLSATFPTLLLYRGTNGVAELAVQLDDGTGDSIFAFRQSDGAMIAPGYHIGTLNPGARGYLGSSTSSTSYVEANSFTEAYDVAGNFDPSTGRFTAPVAGQYQISATMTTYQPDGSSCEAQVRVNGAAVSGGIYIASQAQASGTPQTWPGSGMYYLNAGSYVSVFHKVANAANIITADMLSIVHIA